MVNTAGAEGSLIVKLPFADGIEREGEELEPSASVELVLELNPAREQSERSLERQVSHESWRLARTPLKRSCLWTIKRSL